MAGSFGFEKEHYDISMKIGEQTLFPAIREQGGDFVVVAEGVSCRQQIEQGTGKRAMHLVEALAAAREAGTRITCPLLILWGEGRRNRRPVMMEVWENWATNVEGRGLSCGHFLPEEAPEETRDALLEFFR